MAGHPHTIRNARRLIAAVACTCSFTLAACGGGGGGVDGAINDFTDQIDGAATDSGDGAGNGQSGGEPFGDASPGEAQPPTFVLTGGVEAPPGWVEDPAACAGDDAVGPPYFTFHVPADWDRTGSGSAGSSDTDGSGNHTYALTGGPSVEVEVATDSYDGTEPIDLNTQQPWVSWDYDITSYSADGEESTRATYAALDPVEIDGETVDLWFLDQHQDDLISSSEYKARVVFAEVPAGGMAGQDRQPYSATVTFGWNAEAGALDEAVVRDVLSTFRLDQCVQDAMTELYEMLYGANWSD